MATYAIMILLSMCGYFPEINETHLLPSLMASCLYPYSGLVEVLSQMSRSNIAPTCPLNIFPASRSSAGRS